MPAYVIPNSDWEAASRKLEALAPGVPLSNFALTAKHAVESLHYLADLDDVRFGGEWPKDGYPNDAIDVAHTRWAASTACTALDLCAAVLGRVYHLKTSFSEVTIRDVDPRPRPWKKPPAPETKSVTAHGKLPTAWQTWVSDLLADARYDRLLEARNPLVHATAPKIVYISTKAIGGHDMRYGHRFGMLDAPVQEISAAPSVQGRDVVLESRDLATLHVEKFLKQAAK